MCCTCGETKDHVISRRSTADGKHVLLWSTGELTWALGYRIRGSACPRTEEQRKRALAAGWLVQDWVSLYDASEVSRLVEAARWAADRGLGAEGMRSRLHRRAPLRPAWTVYQTDRDLLFNYPRVQDGHLLHGVLCAPRAYHDLAGKERWPFEPSFREELERRGYDITTLRFSVELKKERDGNE